MSRSVPIASRQPVPLPGALRSARAEVTRLTAQGLSNHEIAERLHVSPSTVKRHLENVYKRTGVGSRGALTALLLE